MADDTQAKATGPDDESGPVDPATLTPDKQNANRGTQRGRGLLEKSLQAYGAGRSIVVDRAGNIIAGNKTHEVAGSLGLPVRVVKTDGRELIAVQRVDLDLYDPDDTAARELAFADNRVGQLDLDWDPVALTMAQAEGIDLHALGFTDKELTAILGAGEAPKNATDDGLEEPSESEAEKLRQKWGTERGQTYTLGKHRLHVGDGTDPATIDALTGGEVLAALVTDPPYSSGGMTRGDRTLDTTAKYIQSGTLKTHEDFSGDNRDQRSWIGWAERWLGEYQRRTKAGGVVAIWSDWRQTPALTDALQGGGWVWRGLSVWDKTEGARPMFGRFRPQAEFLAWGSNGPHAVNNGRPSYPGVFRHAVDSGKLHLTQKPIPVVAWSLSMVDPGGLVADPFAGSGSAILAGDDLGLRVVAVELSAAYAAVILERWSLKTGTAPVREA